MATQLPHSARQSSLPQNGSESPNPTQAAKNRPAFTLIELLVVVSIITLLLALLVPALSRAKRQAQAAACQANLHQWAVILHQYASENDGRWPRIDQPSQHGDWEWWRALRTRYEDPNRLDQCPARSREGGHRSGSFYALNGWLCDYAPPASGVVLPWHRHYFWRHVAATRSPADVPVVLDGERGSWLLPLSGDEPPDEGNDTGSMGAFCLRRHGSFVNGAFMDWSVRRVGLKELWTLKWHREFDTGGPWTKAGAVRPEDWPRWMRNFKDY